MTERELQFLRTAELEVVGRLVDASNATLLCTATADERTEQVVYKPVRGEQPLWDFPDGTLAGREVAAYEVSVATGWGIIPPTVLRDEAPFGPGMVQLWVNGDEDVDLIDLINAMGEPLRRMAVLDAVINNSDRKGGHIIARPTAEDDATQVALTDVEVWGVDHGVSFSVEDKLRTVLWHWAGDPLPDDAIRTLHRLLDDLDDQLGQRLAEHLTLAEVRATRGRIESLLRTGCHPLPSPHWPAVPYPPF